MAAAGALQILHTQSIKDDGLIIDLLSSCHAKAAGGLIMQSYSLHSNFHMQMMSISSIYRPTYMCNTKTATMDQVRRNLCKFLCICYANRPAPHLHISNSFLRVLFWDSRRFMGDVEAKEKKPTQYITSRCKEKWTTLWIDLKFFNNIYL